MILDAIRDVSGAAVPKIVVVDIGAMLEGTARYEPLVRGGCATVIGFEPQQEELAKLRASAPSTHTYFPYILGTGAAGRFYHTRYPGCSSLYEPDSNIIDLFSTIGAAHPGGNFHVEKISEVQTKRLDDIAAFPAPDMVKLDVQGAELDVMMGGAATIAKALVLEIEVEFVPLYRGQPLFGEVHAFAREKGYQFHKFIDVGGRAFAPMTLAQNPYLPISQLLWADAVFVRDFADLTRYSSTDLLKASVILDEIYRSFDLAALLLREFDSRTGTDLCTRYSARLAESPIATYLLNFRETP